MLRDNKLFRERFLRWKNGELVYDNGRPIDQYEIDKDSISDAIYDQEILQASRNNYTHWGFDSTEDAYRRISNGLAPKPHLNDVVTEDAQISRYSGGKDNNNWLTNALIGMSVADNPAIATAAGWKKDRSGNWVQKPTKADKQLGKSLAMLSTTSPTHPVNAAVAGAIGKLAQMSRIKQVYGMLLNNIRLTKASTLKMFDDFIRGNLSLTATATYIPLAFIPTKTTIPSDVYQSIANSTIPRMMLYRPHRNAKDLALQLDNAFRSSKYAEFLPEVYDAAGQAKYGGLFNPNNNFISIKMGKTAPYARLHEARHLIDQTEPILQAEEDLIDKIFNKRFVDPDVEKITTVGDARRSLLGLDWDLTMPVAEQNRFIQRASDNSIIDAYRSANSYGKRYVEALIEKNGAVPQNIINATRLGMQNLGVGAGVGLAIPTTFDARQYKNGKDGIYIKPANRGKFTALKKRTGHSASWFKAHGTPALKKMAVFALNARKWKH